MKDSIEDEKRQAEEAAKKEELRRKAEDAYAKVEAIFKQEKFLEALKEAEHLVDGSWNEKEYLDKVEKLKTDIRTGLKNVLDPLLTEAKNQRQEGGDLVKARDKYREVLAIDKDNAEALRGISEIRDVLLLRAKRYYAEAILAESISELQEAKEKYEKCLHTAPDDPNFPPNMDYRSRCRRKLVRYQAFTPEQQGKN